MGRARSSASRSLIRVPRVLAFDTATSLVSCCLWRDGDVLAERRSAEPRAAQRVLALVEELLAESGVRRDEIDTVGVGTGPGSFTGLRIGIATARGLALGLGVPLGGTGTLDALLAGCAGATAVIDARRGEVFVAGPGREPGVITPAGLAAVLRPGEVLVGDGAVRHREAFAGASIAPDLSPLHAPSAATIAERAGQLQPVDAVYLRRPDAEPVA